MQTNKIDLTVDGFDEDLTEMVERVLHRAAFDIRALLTTMGEKNASVTAVDFAGPAVVHF